MQQQKSGVGSQQWANSLVNREKSYPRSVGKSACRRLVGMEERWMAGNRRQQPDSGGRALLLTAESRLLTPGFYAALPAAMRWMVDSSTL